MRSSGGLHGAVCQPQPISALRHIASLCRALVRDEDAATMAEYALLIALIAMVVALTLLNIGNAVKTKFSSVSSCLAANTNC
jgi:Flp pilus assembly pilin Flp